MIKLFKSLQEDIKFARDAVYLAKYAQYYLIFKTTHYCWFKCPHCCESAGPNHEKTYIPQETIFEILTQAKQDPQFINEVVFTGGEIFSSYKFGDKQYISNLLNFAAKNDIGADIKTNAGWANTSFGNEIFKDLRQILIDNKPQEYRLPKFQISLSLDTYHTNCFENNMKIIKELAGLPVTFSLASFAGQEAMVAEFEKQLRQKFKIDTLINMKSFEDPYLLINDKTFYRHSFATMFDGGRASKLPQAIHLTHPYFTFVQPERGRLLKLVAFDNFGRVTLGENSGRKIMTPYLDENRQTKPLPKIFQDLNHEAVKEALYFIYYDRFFNPFTR